MCLQKRALRLFGSFSQLISALLKLDLITSAIDSTVNTLRVRAAPCSPRVHGLVLLAAQAAKHLKGSSMQSVLEPL